MEGFIGLHRSQGGVPVTQGGGLKNKMPRYPVSPKRVLLIVLLDLLKVSKIFNFNYDLFKISKMYLLKLFFLFSVNAYVHIPVVLFLWLKITINFQKWVYRGMVDIICWGF